MFKVVRFVKRHPSMTHEQFRAYWLEHHAPLQREVADRSPVRRTVVSFTSRQFVTGGSTSMLGAEAEPDFDAILELYFDDIAELSADFPGRDGDVASTIIESEQRFTDQSRDLVRIIAEEVVLVDKSAGTR